MSRTTLGLDDAVTDYVRRVGVREDDVLADLRAATAAMPEARMQVAPEQGGVLAMLVQLIGAKTAVEVGTFTGYSSTCIARALGPDGQLICLDVSEAYTARAQAAWDAAGVADRIALRIAPALDSLAVLKSARGTGWLDFGFVDADKQNYPAYYEAMIDLLRPGGLVAFDNVLWSGKVADPAATDPETQSIRALNDRVHGDDRVDMVLMPIGDGLTLARKR